MFTLPYHFPAAVGACDLGSPTTTSLGTLPIPAAGHFQVAFQL